MHKHTHRHLSSLIAAAQKQLCLSDNCLIIQMHLPFAFNRVLCQIIKLKSAYLS